MCNSETMSSNFKMKLVYLLLILLPISCSSNTNHNQKQQDTKEERCYEDCEGSGLWLYGRGWIIPPYQSEVVGQCLEQPSSQNPSGQGDDGEKALISIYDAVLENVDTILPNNDTEDTSLDAIVRGLSVASEGANIPNSEGMVSFLDVVFCIFIYTSHSE